MKQGIIELSELGDVGRTDGPATGGKARRLGQLIAAGLAVPAGAVIAPEAALDAELLDRLAPLGPRFAVRSSSTLEDRSEAAAPGLFDSFIDVAASDLLDRVARVRASARSDAARAYAEATGSRLPAAIPVVVQRYLAPEVAGTAYTRAPGHRERIIVETAAGQRVELDRVGGGAIEGRAELEPAMLDAIAAAALAAERAIGSIENGADVEWLVHEGRPWLVQARPLPAAVAAPRPRPPGDVFGFAALDASRHWVLDIAHNPEPLSPAQQGLVELVVDGIGAELALACGYLYQVDRAATPPTGEPREIAVELERVFFEEVEPALDRELVILEAGAPSLEPALDRFVAGAREYRRIAAALSAARHASAGLEPALQPRIGAGLCRALAADSRLSPAARERADRLARGGEAAFFAPHAPIWDVAAVTYGEEPERLAQMVAALEQRRRRTNRGGQGERQLLADLGAAVGEIDDRLYYRAQRLVRRALLATGGDDLVWIGLETARAMARGALVRGVAEQAAAARELYRRQRELSMPRAVRGGVWEWQPFTSGAALRGAGRGGRARGPAARSRPRPGDIWCTADLTPGDALAATAAAGIALEHGTLLGHGAAMAQELGIPVVVQIPGLCARIREGEPLFIDGDAGLLLRL